ncbi:MAG: hypothetical protein MRECE_27c010 [Mycoplasmataceae bacterium CE_OT135]|nr:MAG: hypothetical protein MRECE_27c010 [Mycoplasmataceae bacterium CE_OT135]
MALIPQKEGRRPILVSLNCFFLSKKKKCQK